MTQLQIVNQDNRDSRTTWLWIDNDRYVEVDPIELAANALENLGVPDNVIEDFKAQYAQIYTAHEE